MTAEAPGTIFTGAGMDRSYELSTLPDALCRVAAPVLIACSVLTSTSCQDENAAVSLPTPSQSRAEAHADSTQSPSAAELEAVRRTYRQFVATLDRASTIPVATRKEQLSQYMVEPQLSRVLKTVKKHEANGISTYGRIAVHITDVQIRSNEVTVHDCQDSRKAGLIDTSTNKKINRGIKGERATATLKKGSDRQWRVSTYVFSDKGC